MLEVKETFKKEIKGLSDYIILITSDAKNYRKACIDVLRFLINEQGIPGVYVTLNKPYDIMQRDILKNKIDTRLIIFIDTTSRAETGKRDNCLCIGSPEKLSDMSVAIEQAVKALASKDKFLIFDSLNTLNIFNKPATVARFVHFLAGKMRELKVKGIIITLEKETEQSLLDELGQLSDAAIKIGGEP